MDGSLRAVVLGSAAAAIGLIIFAPGAALWVVVAWLVGQGVLAKAALRRVDEPYRAIVIRLGQLHRLSPSGVFFLVPWAETLGERVTMQPLSLQFDVYQLAAADGESIYMNLELTWRLRPDIERIDDLIKQVLLKDTDQRRTMVEQAVTVVARQIVLGFASDQIKKADVRESVMEVLRSTTNELLAPHGLVVDTIFWRGSVPSKDLVKAKTQISVSRARLEAMLRDVELIQSRLPGVSAEEFLAYQAWMELIRQGISPPGVPNAPQFPVQMPFPPAVAPPRPPPQP